MTKVLLSIALLAVAGASACGPSSLRVEPVKIEPIHVVIDVNLHDQGDSDSAEPARRK